MTFKFINWFLAQKKHDSKKGKLAKRCLDDEKFPIQAKLFQEVLDYFEESNEFKKSDVVILKEAWNEFRHLGKIEVLSLTQIKSRYFDSYL